MRTRIFVSFVQLADLQRKYRIMEGNRKSYSDDSQNVIKKQRVAIEQVKDENAALRHVSKPFCATYEAHWNHYLARATRTTVKSGRTLTPGCLV
jgi:hypothetical protein